MRVGEEKIAAHRLSFILYKGPITDDLYVLHRCNNSLCVNPDHLYLGNQSDNVGDTLKSGRHYQASNTHCPHGHELTPENTYITGVGSRQCKICRKMHSDRANAKRAAKRLGLIIP
jgi:hypothetical protein